jgi:hypothetical protein
MRYSTKGPYGTNLDQQLHQNFLTNTAFSQRAWENTKQDQCLPPPGGPQLPMWPPIRGNSVRYPALDKESVARFGLESHYQFNEPFSPNSNPNQYNPHLNKIQYNQQVSMPANHDRLSNSNNITNQSLYNKINPKILLPCIKNTLNGIHYDMKNWDNIKDSNKIYYIFCRDDRWLYLLILFIIIYLFVTMYIYLFGSSHQ